MSRRRLSGHAVDVAPLLLGARISSTIDDAPVVIRLTEVEAYGGVGSDPGSHAYRGRTARNATMFGPAGHVYVYFTYGMHWCVNIVTDDADVAGAVLLRAGEVVRGVRTARDRRGHSVRDRDLARGPARLAVALGVTGRQDGIDAFAPRSPIRLRLPAQPPSFATSPRTGVGGAGAQAPWRFYLDGEPTVSPYRKAVPRARS